MKKLIAILLAAAMILSVAAVMGGCAESAGDNTTAAPDSTPAAHTHAVNAEGESLTWEVWDGNAITEKGTYNLYLDADLKSANQVVLGDIMGVNDITVNLCLNGHNWSSDARAALIASGVTLNICNCQSTEATITGKGDEDSVSGGTFLVNEAATLTVYEGVNITADNSQGRVNYAGVIELSGTMNIYGATITGTEVARIANSEGAADTTTGQGGAIGMRTNSTLNMYSGLITGGTACTGANVRMEANSVFNMYGGKITNGYSKSYVFNGSNSGGNGGGVFVEGAKFYMYNDAEISGNKCDNKGAGVILNGSGWMEMYDTATVTGNHANNDNYAGGVACNAAATTLTWSDSVVIDGNTNNAGKANCWLKGDNWLANIIDTLNADAKIGMTIEKNANSTFTDLAAPIEAFYSDVEGYEIVANENGTLALKAVEAGE